MTSNAFLSSNSGVVEDDEDVNDKMMKSDYHEEGVEDSHAVYLLFHVVWM